MARHRIHDDSGKPTQYFWSDKHGTDRARMVVFKETNEGIKKMKNVYYDAVKLKMHRPS